MAIHESLSIATRGTKSTKKLRCGYTASLPASADLGDLIVQNLLFLFRFFRVLRGKNKSFNLLPLCLPLRTSAISAFTFFFSSFVFFRVLRGHTNPSPTILSACLCGPPRSLCSYSSPPVSFLPCASWSMHFFRSCLSSPQTPNQPARLTDE